MNIVLTLIIILIGAGQSGASMAPPHIPEGTPPSLEATMVSLYDAAADDINRLTGRAVAELAEDPQRRASQFRQIRAAQMQIAIRDRIERLGVQTSRVLEQPLNDSVRAAIKRGDEELAKIGLAPVGDDRSVPGATVGFGVISGEAVEVIAEDTVNRARAQITDALGNSIAGHGENALAVFRSLSTSVLTQTNPSAEANVNRAIARGLITGNPTIADRAIRELFAENSAEAQRVRKLGNKLIEVGNATMTVRQYAMTVTRTRTREATVEGRHRRLQERGVNLVQITGKNSANFCTAFIGLVCSLGPAPAIDGLTVVELATLPGGGPPFHPNCSKGTAPYIHELASRARQAEGRRAAAVYQKRASSGRLLAPVK